MVVKHPDDWKTFTASQTFMQEKLRLIISYLGIGYCGHSLHSWHFLNGLTRFMLRKKKNSQHAFQTEI